MQHADSIFTCDHNYDTLSADPTEALILSGDGKCYRVEPEDLGRIDLLYSNGDGGCYALAEDYGESPL